MERQQHKLLFLLLGAITTDVILYSQNTGGFGSFYYTLIVVLFILTSFLIYVNNLQRICKIKKSKSVAHIFFLFLVCKWGYSLLVSSGYYEYKFLLMNVMPFMLIFSLLFTEEKGDILKVFYRYIVLVILGLITILYLTVPDINVNVYSRLGCFSMLGYLWWYEIKNIERFLTVLLVVAMIFLDSSHRYNYFFFIGFWLFRIMSRYVNKRLFVYMAIVIAVVISFIFIGGNAGSLLKNYEGLIVQQEYDYETDVVADTRSFLWAEVISHVVNEERLFLGVQLGSGYNTVFFNDIEDGLRRQTEVQYLNYFLYFGILGVFMILGVKIRALYNVRNNLHFRDFMFFLIVTGFLSKPHEFGIWTLLELVIINRFLYYEGKRGERLLRS